MFLCFGNKNSYWLKINRWWKVLKNFEKRTFFKNLFKTALLKKSLHTGFVMLFVMYSFFKVNIKNI